VLISLRKQTSWGIAHDMWNTSLFFLLKSSLDIIFMILISYEIPCLTYPEGGDAIDFVSGSFIIFRKPVFLADSRKDLYQPDMVMYIGVNYETQRKFGYDHTYLYGG
jgi:hypothetical protein